MALYAISDFHISHANPKSMDIFGKKWVNHWQKICEAWRQIVTDDDLVLVPGDISWAMYLQDALLDLQAIGDLPGEKLLMRGNHDYWWNSVSKVRAVLPRGMYALQNDFFPYDAAAICGARGWLCPGTYGFSADDQKVYNREVNRLELSLTAARRAGLDIPIVMFHYPPFNDRLDNNGFLQLLSEYGIKRAIYGHLHGADDPFQGEISGTKFNLVSCDYLDFKPLRLSD